MRLYEVFVLKQKTAYEMRISDWSADVCSSDLVSQRRDHKGHDPDTCEAYAYHAVPRREGQHGTLRRGEHHGQVQHKHPDGCRLPSPAPTSSHALLSLLGYD